MATIEWPDETQEPLPSEADMPLLLVSPGQILVDQFGNRKRIWAISINDDNQLLVSLADSHLTTEEASSQATHYFYSAILQRIGSGYYRVDEEPNDLALTLPPPGAVIFKRTDEGPCIRVARVLAVHWQVVAGTPPYAMVNHQPATTSKCVCQRAPAFYQQATANGWFVRWTNEMLIRLDPGLSATNHLW